MSTTVTYKDNTLTTLSNATKTLKTAGKYMEGDVILVDDSATGSVYQDQDGYLVIDDSESSAPQGNISITENGTYDVADYAGASINIGGDALEYEEGTLVLTNPVSSNYSIEFSNTHTKLPSYYIIAAVTDEYTYNTSCSVAVSFSLIEDIGTVSDENGSFGYGLVSRLVIDSTAYQDTFTVIRLKRPSSDLTDSSTDCPRYWATESRITLPAGSKYKASGTYKWMAVWR